MGLIQVQTDFTHGELSPLMRSRYDTKLYLKACERLTNMLVLPQGAATRRFGSNFIEDINTSPNEYQLFEFRSVEGENFLLMLTDLELRIFNDDGTQHASSPIVFPFTGAQLSNSEIRYAQTHDESLFVHPDVQPKALRFNPTTNTFTAADFTFKNPPTFDFQDVDYSGSTFTLSVSQAGQSGTITSTVALFDGEYVNGIFIYLGTDAGSPVGLARLTGLVNANVMNITVVNEFNSNVTSTGAPGVDSILEKVAISSTKGWPLSVTFYENRLILGGTKSLPQTLFMSQIGDYRDFSIGSGQDSDAIVATISSNENNNILHLVADRSLQVFTVSGEFSPPQLEATPLTPTAISIRKQSTIGSDPRSQPQVIDNNTLYSQRGGRSIMAFVYDDNAASYQSVESSTVSNHLISDVIDMTTLKGRSDSDANFLFLVNAGTIERIDETLPEGSIAAFQTIAEQNIKAWSPIITQNGKYKRIQAVGDVLFYIVEREIDGNTFQYLEKANFDSLTDSNIEFTAGAPTTIVGGLGHLEGETVSIIADGFVVTPEIVVNGELTVDNAATVFEIGLDVVTEVRVMPINANGESGPLLPIPKRLPRNFIDLYKSQGVVVNGVQLKNLLFSEEFITDPLPLRSGLFEVSNLDGWDRRQTISITQYGPFKMTVLGIGYEVDL